VNALGLARLDRRSMRSRLLVGILLPMLVLIALNAVSQYRRAREAADIAYDRTLLASAKSIGEMLEVAGSTREPQLVARVPYAALEAFEADNRSRMFYRVLGFAGETVSGYADLPPLAATGERGEQRAPRGPGPYAALVEFYDDVYQGEAVRVAVLQQPVTGFAPDAVEATGRVLTGMATIQVAETLELRRTLARRALVDAMSTQALLLAVIALVVIVVVQRATRPVREISAGIEARGSADLHPIEARGTPSEVLPLIEAINRVMGRLERLLAHQKRFVRDASHQLRTPLAVLKTQLQSAKRGDVEPAQALHEIAQTVERATELANQMLSLAKVEQLRQQGDAGIVDWADVLRAVAIDLSPLIAEKQLDFDLALEPAPVRAHEWALRELVRNLLHNAIKHLPEDGRLAVSLRCEAGAARLEIADNGPGLSEEQRQRLFQPFAAAAAHAGGTATSGTGLGLAICHEIVIHLGGQIGLENRLRPSAQGPRVDGLDASVRLPLAQAQPSRHLDRHRAGPEPAVISHGRTTDLDAA
jgi:two-component system sensor histidine kinase TctE